MQSHSTDLHSPARRQGGRWLLWLALAPVIFVIVIVAPVLLFFFAVRYVGGPALAVSRPAPTSTAVVARTPATVNAPAPIRLSGDLSQNTAPFNLAAGNYVAVFKTELSPGETTCYPSADLKRVTDGETIQRIYDTRLDRRNARTTAGGETRLYGVVGGTYYLAATVIGSCAWSVEIRPA